MSKIINAEPSTRINRTDFYNDFTSQERGFEGDKERLSNELEQLKAEGKERKINREGDRSSELNSFGGKDGEDFNREFVFKKKEIARENKVKSQEKLDRLTEAANIEEKSLYNLSIVEFLIGIKNTWFEILDDILAGNFSMSIITAKNRLFFIGLTIVLMAMILYIYNYFTNEEDYFDDQTVGGLI